MFVLILKYWSDIYSDMLYLCCVCLVLFVQCDTFSSASSRSPFVDGVDIVDDDNVDTSVDVDNIVVDGPDVVGGPDVVDDVVVG